MVLETPDGEGDTQLHHLQKEILVSILQLTGDPRSILNARIASTLLRDAGRYAIEELVCVGGYISPNAWLVFPCASKVVLRYAPSQPTFSFLHQTLRLILELPERIESIDFSELRLSIISAAESMQLALQMVASACRNSIKRLSLIHVTSTDAVDVILRGLPHLQHVCFENRFLAPLSSTTWRPSADLSSLAYLKIWSTMIPIFDLAGLSTARQLQHCEILSETFTGLSALSSLASLQSLHLSSVQQIEVTPAQALAISAGLQQLSSLTATNFNWPAASWAALASLPSLADIHLHNVTIDAAAPAAAAATSLACHRLHLEQQPEGLLPGCLARQLPRLQRLSVSNTGTVACLQQALAALRGHTALQRLRLGSPHAVDPMDGPG